MTELEKQKQNLLTKKYNDVTSDAYLTDVKRLTTGEPYEYVLGFVDFLGAHIDLSHKPMIPRPETAFWVAQAINELQAKDGPLHLADCFAGAGNVALALLLALPEATVDISEIDPALAAQIAKNVALNKIDLERVIITSASDIQGLLGPYDAIFAVPPYVPYNALPELDEAMRDYEPHLAFFAHENGHQFHRLLITEAYALLKPGGTLYMEADFDHNEKIKELVGGTAWSALEFWPDPYGATPNVVLRK